MPVTIALAGNPNSGKTTMFNDLTGSSQYVGNWPGVTVEKKEGKLRGNKGVTIQDLPGIYSLSPYTQEEVVSRNFLVKERPDVVINIVDASNIERNLYLTTQLLELGIPVVVALNMIDIVRKNGDTIDIGKLEELLGCPVVETSALKGIGSKEVTQKAIELAGSPVKAPGGIFSPDVEGTLSDIAALLQGKVEAGIQRWYAIKLFERDADILEQLHLDAVTLEKIETIAAACEEKLDDDSESIMTGERYTYIDRLLQQAVKRQKREALSTSDKIDRIVTNRVLALPIFAAVMFLVYFLSISTVGTAMTDWVNEGLFEDGFHLFGIGAGEFEELDGEFAEAEAKIDALVEAAEEAGYDTEVVMEALAFDAEEFQTPTEALAAEAEAEEAIDAFVEFAVAANLTAEAELISDEGEVEDIVEVAAAELPELLEVEEPDPADYGIWIPSLMTLAEDGLNSIGTHPALVGLVVDGIIAGVGAVLGFLPQMLVLFLCLAILEDCGYMARIAFIMDRIFRRFGLSGKSFIPILVGTGCGVPGIMASRTIESEADRRMTIITTTFIPCGAKLPIIALIAGALFPGSVWVAPSAYFLGIAAILVSGIMLKKTRAFAGDPAPFVMELPAYHLPGIKGVLIHMWDRGKAFVKKAGTIILLACILVWFLSSFSWSMQMVEADESMMAAIGRVLAPLFIPLGWGDWEAAVASITGLIAKENVVGTMAVLYGGMEEVAENGYEFWGILAGRFTQLSAYSFLVFNLLCAPCFAAIGAVRREMMSAKWTWFAIAYQCGFAYAVALIIYQLGMLFTGGGFGVGTVAAFALIVGILYMMIRKPSSPEKPLKGVPQKAVH